MEMKRGCEMKLYQIAINFAAIFGIVLFIFAALIWALCKINKKPDPKTQPPEKNKHHGRKAWNVPEHPVFLAERIELINTGHTKTCSWKIVYGDGICQCGLKDRID